MSKTTKRKATSRGVKKVHLNGNARKFELTNEKKDFYGTTLTRIRAVRNFGDVKAGDIGGYVETEANLSHAGTCWIDGDGKCYDDSVVADAARVSDKGRVFNGAQLMGHAVVKGKGALGGQVVVGGNAVVTEPALAA